MCEVQILVKFGKNKITPTDVRAFFTMLEYGSYSNADAWGVFTKGYMFRQSGAFHAIKDNMRGGITKAIVQKQSNFLVGHNRLATQGSHEVNINNHPFPSKDWVIVHNGVLSNDSDLKKEQNLQYKEETDSAVIVHLLQRHSDDGDSPEDAIKAVAEALTGRFSICAYNKTEDRVFYFKSSQTSFTFRLFVMNDGSEVLVGSTGEDNLDRIYVDSYMIFTNPLYQTYYETTASSGTIYELTSKEVKILDHFKEREYHQKTHFGDEYSGYGTRFPRSEMGNSSTNSNFTVHGGIFANDWEKTNWQDQKNYRDIDYTDHTGEIIPYDKMDVRDDLEEYSQQIISELEDRTALEWDYQVDWKNGVIALCAADSPVSINELKDQVSETIGIKPDVKSSKEYNYLLLPFEEVISAYR